MKSSSIINLLLGASLVSAYYKDTLPAMSGTAYTPTTATTSCFKCIRGGWIWCSAKWNYEEAGGSYSSTEKGACCFAAASMESDILDNTIANVVKCPARFSNSSGNNIVPYNANQWWCSS